MSDTAIVVCIMFGVVFMVRFTYVIYKMNIILEEISGMRRDADRHDEKLNEHDKWAIQAKGELQTSLTEVKDGVRAVQQTLSADERLRQERLKNMTDRAIKDSIDKLYDFSKKMQRLSLENAMLQKEVAGFREENSKLRQENAIIREENDALRQADLQIEELERDER